MQANIKRFIRLLPLAACAALLYISPKSSAMDAVWLEETLFLGEAVPLRVNGIPLEEQAARAFGDEPGEIECWWISPEGQRNLEELAGERPRQDTDYHISAVLHREDGRDAWLELIYRVRVKSGTIRVRAEGPCVETGTVLLELQGRGLSMYAEARPDPDPQGGPPCLLAEFTGLPFGTYTVTAVGQEEQEVCRLGLCEENDTVDPSRSSETLRFTLGGSPNIAAGGSFRLGADV